MTKPTGTFANYTPVYNIRSDGHFGSALVPLNGTYERRTYNGVNDTIIAPAEAVACLFQTHAGSARVSFDDNVTPDANVGIQFSSTNSTITPIRPGQTIRVYGNASSALAFQFYGSV